jgi:aminopeptidase N
MKKLFIILSLFISPLCRHLQAQEYTALDSLRGGWHAYRSCFDLLHYHLKLKVNPQSQFISGSNRWTCRGLEESAIIQADLDMALNILSINTSGGAARWTRKGSSVLIDLPFRIKAGEDFWIEIRYEGQPHVALNPPWDGGFVWTKDETGKPWIGVACEGSGASLWYPAKDHPADEADSALLEYEVPSELMAVGNGQFLGRELSGDTSAVFRYKVSYPINHYNITFNAAAYRTWNDTLRLPESGEVLQMSFYALPQDLEKAKKQWSQARSVLLSLSKSYGDYPFIRDGYKVVQTPYLGMEHQSCIAYGSQFQDNEFGFDFILMHETAHEWWGNRTSADDHADLWLHEAFATYAEAVYVEKLKGKNEAIRYLLEQRKKIRNRSAMAGKRGVYFNDWKDSDIYYKGTWMLHSMRYAIGNDKRWFSALHDIGAEIGFKPVSADSFTVKFSRLLKKDIRPMVNHYTRFLTWPNLEYGYKLDKGKEVFNFRWISSAEGFGFAAPVVMDGNTERIDPGTGTVNFENKRPMPVMKIEPSESLYLFKMQYRKF